MKLFNGKKSELVKSQEELSICQVRIAEVQATLGNLQTITNAIALEIELTGTDSALEKRSKKLAIATEKAEKDLADLTARQAEIEASISVEQEKERLAKLTEAARLDAELHADYLKAVMLKQELERLMSPLDGRWGGIPSPTHLNSLLGLRYGDRLPAEAQEVFSTEAEKLRASVEAEVAQIVSQIRKATKLD